MAEGQRFSERKSRLQDFKAGLQGDQGAGTQQTQQTQQDTSGQQATGGVFLPGINTDYSSTLPKTGYQGALESGKIQSNVVLPGINDKPKIENATLDTTTIEQQRRANVRARNNVSDQQSWNEKIEDEMYKSQTIPVIQQGIKQGWNDIKKRTYRYGLDFIENPYSYLSKMYPTGITERLLFNNKSLVSQKKLDEMRKNYDKYSNKLDESFNKWVDNNINQTVANKYAEKGLWNSFKEGDWKNFDYGMKQAFSTSVIPMLPGIVAGFITKNPAVLAGVGYLPAEAVENQEAYDEALKLGATREQAEMIGNTAGKINGVLEIIGEIFQLKGILKPVKKGITDEVVKYTMKSGSQIIRRALLNLGRGTLGEGTTEAMQEIVTNSLLSMLDNRDIMQGVLDSFLAGFFMGAPSSTLSSVGGAIQDQENNKKIEQQADLEALQYVMEGEERKAQRMQQAKQRMKDRFLGKDTTEEFTQEDQEQFEREGVEEQQQSEELRTENNRETTIQNEMEREVLSEGDLNEDLGDPRFQKTEATDTNEINKDLKDIKDSLEKMDDNTFFNRIMASINKGGKRNFVVFNKNGQKSVLRVMETKSKGKGSGKTVTVQVMQPSKKSGNVIMSQFTYNPGNLSMEQKQGIITGFENWGKTGNFVDNTSSNEKYQLKYEEKDYNPGVAGKNEKNISGKEGVKQRNKINDETIEQLAKKYGVKVEVIKGLVKVLKNGKWTGGYAYGKYLDQVLTLSEQIKESTAPHELLHAIFDMIDPETKAYLISQVMKSEGWSAKKAEEWLADSFSNFFRTGKIEGAPKSTWGKIKIFFKRVRSFINGLGKWRSELEEIFSDIITSEGIEELQGRIDQNKRLQEAKARMRERFMQYAKNAEKMQKKAENTNKSEAKYQEAEQDGISALQKIANGAEYVRDAMNREDLKQYGGETGISFYWGEPGDKSKKYKGGYGISHIAEKHGADTLLKMIEVLARGKITRYAKSIDRVSIGYDGYTAILSLSKDNGKETRLVTGRKDNEKKTDGSSEVSTQSTPTQTSPTFSRTDLGAVLSKDIIYKNDKNANKNEEKFQLAGDINSEAFKKRFGDSKIVNKNGTPKIMYHGTPYGGFTIFKGYNRGSIGDDGYFGRGFYFTDDKALARDYSDEAFIDPEERTTEPGEYGNVEIKEVYLKVENPYIIEQKDVEYDKGALEKLLGTKDPSESTKKLQDEGYDGVIYRFDDGVEEVTVFEPNQIKSATDNVGTYDINNDDIRYQTVYHGSPAEFEKFDSKFMGKGEGDQVHGRGHYVSVDPKTGRYYAETLAGPRYKGKEMYELASIVGGYEWNVINHVAEQMKDGVGIQEAIDADKRWHEYLLNKSEEELKTEKDENNIDYLKDEIKRQKEMIKIADNLKASDFESAKGRRHFYEIEIPDPVSKNTPTGSNYLEEDEVINEEAIGEIISKLEQKKPKGWERTRTGIEYDLSNGDINGRNLVYNLRAGLGHKQASKFLEKLGYDGIHYFGGRDGEAYVIFNDDALEITNHEKYQETDDIDPEARDPYKMISQTGKAGNTTNVTYVFDKFISEKAKDKALHSVPKEWLNEGKAPALMHTNKYVDKPFYRFDNVKDSRYKRAGDGIVVSFFTDNFYMSQSYARGIPTVAKTKKGNISDAELKQELKRMSEDNSSKGNESLFGGLYSDKETKFSTQKNKDGTVSLVSKQKFYQHYDYERFIRDYTTQTNLDKMGITYSEVFKDPDKVIDFLIENVNKTFDGKDAYVKASREDNGVLVEIYDKSIKGTYPTLDELKDNIVRNEEKEDAYSYIGYGQNIKKLLLLDQFKGEYWNQMGRLDDVFNLKNIHYEKEVRRFIDSVYKAMDGLSYRMEAFKERYNDSEFNRNTYDESGKMKEEVRIIGDLIGSVDEGVISMMDYLRDLLDTENTTEAKQKVLDSYTTGDLTTRGETVREALEELYDFLDHNYNELRRLDWNGIKDWIYDIGGSAGDVAVLEHHYNTNWSLMKDTGRTWKEDMARDLNPKFNMETNDWVRYAIAEGYDAIKMEEIYDYGGNVDYELPGNIYVTLRNNEFKAWDNADPTDSSDIRYQTVYHGSRADFENFDSTHMGEGEGNQAHGRGHYVAVDPATARHYAEITGKGDYTWGYDGKTYNDLIREYISGGRERGEIALLTDLIQDMGNTFGQYTMQEIIDKRIERAEKALKNDEAILREEKNLGTPGYATVEDIQGWIAKDKKTLEALKSIDVNKFYEAEPARKRNFYEVEIPDSNGRNYIEETSKVGKKNQNRIAEQFKKEGWTIQESYGHLFADNYDENGKLVEIVLPDPDQTWEQRLGYDINNPKEISQLLNRAGWVGIHYYGGRDGEAYVIFNDNDLDIRNHEKYQMIDWNGESVWDGKDDKEVDWNNFGIDNLSEEDKIQANYLFGNNNNNGQGGQTNQKNGGGSEAESSTVDGGASYEDSDIFPWDDEQTRSLKRARKAKEEEQRQKEIIKRVRNELYIPGKDIQRWESWRNWIKHRLPKDWVSYKDWSDEVDKSLNDAVNRYITRGDENIAFMKDIRSRIARKVSMEDRLSKVGKNKVYDTQYLKSKQLELDKYMEDIIKDIQEYYNWDQFQAYDEYARLEREVSQEENLTKAEKSKHETALKRQIKADDKTFENIEKGNYSEFLPEYEGDRWIEWTTSDGKSGRISLLQNPKKYYEAIEKANDPKNEGLVRVEDITDKVMEERRKEEEKKLAKKKEQEERAEKEIRAYHKNMYILAFKKLEGWDRLMKDYPYLTEDDVRMAFGLTPEEWSYVKDNKPLNYPPKRWSNAKKREYEDGVNSKVREIRERLTQRNSINKKKYDEQNLPPVDVSADEIEEMVMGKGDKEVEEFENLAKEEKKKEENVEEGKSEWEKDMDNKNEKAKKQAEKLTKKWKEDVSDMFRKAEEKRNERYANKEEKKIDEVKTVEEAKEITKESRWKIGKDFIEDKIIKDTFQPLSTRIEKISPRVYREMMRFEQNITVKNNIRMKQVEDFVKKMAKIRSKNKKDYLNITLNLLNGNVGTANQMLEKYGTSIPRQLLDEIWADAEDVGYTMNYEGFYYPRKVKDVKDFLDRFAKTENKDVRGEIDKIIEEKEKKARARGEEFTPQMKADLINQLLLEGEIEGISLGSGHMKKRKVESITKNMLKFYEDPVDSLLQYITGMTEAIEKARFLGQGTRGEIKTLGEFIADEGISGYDADELKDLLLSRFNYVPMGPKMAKLKVIGNIIHLGNPSTTLTQLGDFAFSFIENGLTNVIEGLTKKYNLDLNELGITNLGEEYKSQGKKEIKLEKVQRFIFKKEFFNWMDQFGKRTFVVSTLNKLIKYAKRNDPQLRKDLSRRFDDPKMIDEVINDLKEGKISKNVSLFLFTKLSDVQPLTRLQMPKTYQKAGNWRILYAFKTYGIKKLDYILQTSKRELATKPTAEAVWKIVSMALMFMLFEAGTDEIKDALYRRRYNSLLWRIIEGNGISADMLSDKFWDSFWKMRGFNRYVIYQARTEGIKSAVEGILFSIPGLDLFTYPLQDLQDAISEDGLDWTQASTWQLLPLVGKAEYRWVGAGQTKQQKKLDKEKKKNSSSGGSSRSTRTTRSRNTRNTRNSR